MDKKNIEKVLHKNLETNFFPHIQSFTQRPLSLIWEFNCGEDSFILKIPKRRKNKKPNLNKIISDKKISKQSIQEWKALNCFYKISKTTECPINFIKPIIFIKELSGIVTKKVEGKDFYKYLRKDKNRHEKNKKILHKIGKGYYFLHKNNKAGKLKSSFQKNKFNDKKLNKKINNIFRKYNTPLFPSIKTMSGFTIRDIIISKRGEIYFLDPGKIKEKIFYKDLARLIVDIKILHQGKITFPFINNQKTQDYEISFLRGYFKNFKKQNKFNKKILGSFILNSLLFSYSRANKKFNKRFPDILLIKNIFKSLYLDKVYREKIINIIKNYGL